MEKLRGSHGHSMIDRALRFLSIRLRSRPETAALAPEIDAERTQLRQVEDRWLEARELRVAATAELEFLDAELDRAVADLARQALVIVQGRRNDDRYRQLFAMAPSQGTGPIGGVAQERYVRALLAQLNNEAGPFPTLREHAKPIEDALAALKTAEERRAELYVPEQAAASERAIAFDRARRAYNTMYPRLRVLFAENDALAESYFARLRSNPAFPGDPSEPEPS